MIIDDILDVCKKLDELDTFNNESNEKLSLLDKKISDLYHYLENKNLNYKQCYQFCKELKSLLVERRILKRNMSIYKVFSLNKQKLINGIENRQLFLTEIYKEDKNWNEPYKNNIYNAEELKEIIES